MRAVGTGEPISLPVMEPDGALTGWKTKPAPFPGLYIERGEMSAFIGADVINAEVRRLRRLK